MRFIIIFSLLFTTFAFAEQNKKTICLNMIVKNESDVIEKCLESVKPLIDYWVISDTGSTDGTQEIIKKALKEIPGELHEDRWVDFSHNRNIVLKASKNKADYLLFVDADEVIVSSIDFIMPELTKDCYFINIRGEIEAKRKFLINNRLNWEWKGVLHEDVESPDARTFACLEGIVNRIDLLTGARSKDPEKYLKDADILKKALQKDPNNSRYAYYLALTYCNAEKYDLALKWYDYRIAMKSSNIQETYFALFYKGVIQEKLQNYSDALCTFYQAHYLLPIRAEPLLHIATIYRKQNNYLLGYLVSQYALTLPYPKEALCVDFKTYEYKLHIELANCLLLMGKFQEGLEVCQKLLDNPNLPQDIKGQVASNFHIAKKKVSCEKKDYLMNAK